MDSLPPTDNLVDEVARRKFETELRTGATPAIEAHLPPADDPRFLATLEELVHIDLEMGWKAGKQPRVEDYVTRFPQLNDPGILLRLLRQEAHVRHAHGDRPPPSEYASRFPDLVSTGVQMELTGTRSAASTVTLPPTIPGYEILRTIARGGMGVVYEARQLGLNRIVALKMIAGGSDPEDEARFRTEAEAAATLHHPNIVQVFEVGTAPSGGPYLALEYVSGGTLAQYIDGTPQTPRAAAAIAEQIARAVHVAHTAGILHRDLKPANILLAADRSAEIGDRKAPGTRPPPPSSQSPPSDLQSPTPKVADFGLAKRWQNDAGQTQTGAILGTPSYMAPEQAEGRKDLDPRTDVYGLGATLYELLTGRPPFRAATPLDTIAQVIRDDPVAPSRFQPKLPRDLETICLKCLRKEPTDRYATAGELVDDLRRYLNGEPIAARPVRTWERAAKWVRRRPTAAGLLVAIAVAALATVGGTVALYFNGQLRDALDLAEVRREEADEQRGLAESRKLAAEGSAVEAVRQRGVAEQNAAEAAKARADADRNRDHAERYQYIAQIGLAQRAWEEKNVPRLLELLELHRPKEPGARDRRHFEWHLLRRQSRNLLFVQAHSEDVAAVAFSPDGKWLASGGWDNTVKVWNPLTGALLRTLTFTPTGKWQRVLTVEVAPTGDRLAVAFHTTVTLYDTATWQPAAILAGHTAHVVGLAFSADGARVATGSADGTARIWEAATGKLLFTLAAEPNESLRSVTFTPDGSGLAWGSALVDDSGKVVAGAAKAWDLNTRRAVFSRRLGARGVEEVAFDPTGWRLAVAAGDGAVRVFEFPSGEERLKLATGETGVAHEKGAQTARFSPDGRHIATAGYDRAVRVWDAVDGKLVWDLRGHLGRESVIQARGVSGVNRVAFSRDGRRLASAGDGGTVLVWDVSPPLNPLPPKRKPTPNQFFSPTRTRVAVWRPERKALEVNETTDSTLLHTLKGESDHVRTVRYDVRDDRLLVGYGEKSREFVQVWDPTTGRSLLTARPAPNDRLHLSPDGRYLVAAGAPQKLLGDTYLRIWDVTTGKEVTAKAGHIGQIGLVSFSPDGRHVATTTAPRPASQPPDWALADGAIRVWELATGRLVSTLTEHTWAVRGAAWTPDGKLFASASQDGRVFAWEPLTGRLVQRFAGVRSSVYAVAFSPDGKRIASGGEDKTVRLWDLFTGEEILALKRHSEIVFEVKFGPEGHYLLSRGGTDEWQVWDARPPEK